MTETEATARILPEYKFVLGQEMSEAVHQALGAASVCWEPMDCTGVFQEHRARQIAGELMEIAMQYAQAYPESLKPSAPDDTTPVTRGELAAAALAADRARETIAMLGEDLIRQRKRAERAEAELAKAHAALDGPECTQAGEPE